MQVGVNKYYESVYKRLNSKLSNDYRSKTPRMISSIILSFLPFVGVFLSFGSQTSIDDLRKEIGDRLDSKTMKEIKELQKLAKKNKLKMSEDETKRLIELDKKIRSKFDESELKALQRIAKKGGK